MAQLKASLTLLFCLSMIALSLADRVLQQGGDKGQQSKAANRNARGLPKNAKGKALQLDINTCGGAQQIGSSASENLCCPLCWCVGNQSPNKIFAGAALQQLCRSRCSDCVVEANKCSSPNDPLPKTCKQGLQFNSMIKNLVNTCVNMYNSDPASISRAEGC